MKWENKVRQLCFFGIQRAWISALISLVPLLIFAGLLGIGLFSSILLTFTVLILSTTFFTHSKPIKDVQIHNPSENKDLLDIPDKKIPAPTFEDRVEKPREHENKTTPEEKQAQEEQEQEAMSPQTIENRSVSSRDLQSESECLDFSDDGSISDEESLIEIALPSGHYVRHDDHKKMPADLFPQCIFKQRSLMELLAEINEFNIEEENLIEIDISIGSIKCSRFEIEA